jgi:hypothetical protein
VKARLPMADAMCPKVVAGTYLFVSWTISIDFGGFVVLIVLDIVFAVVSFPRQSYPKRRTKSSIVDRQPSRTEVKRSADSMPLDHTPKSGYYLVVDAKKRPMQMIPQKADFCAMRFQRDAAPPDKIC